MRHPISHLLTAALLAAVLAPAARAQTGYPMITSVYPAGCRRDAVTEITVTGSQNFAGAYGVLFEAPGMAAEIVPPEKPPEAGKPVNTVTLKVTAGPDVPLGPQEFRVATPQGISTLGLLVVGTEPEVLEKEGNNTVGDANPIELPVTVNGRIQQAEDVDCYRFTAKAGETVTFHCISARLQDKVHDLTPGAGGAHSDPILTLTDESGRELAIADDYYGPDPLFSYRFEKDGAYVIQIRDVRYMGMAGWTYRLTCTPQPFLTGVFPMAGQRGQAVEVRPVGFNLDGMGGATVEVPMMEPGTMDVRLPAGAEMTNPVTFVVSELPQVQETGDNSAPEKANPVQLPCGINGRIEAENDVDHYRFQGVKGQVYTFEVFARRYGSSLDSFLQVLDAQGKSLANNDDAVGKDSRLDWSCPADGEYVLQVSDLHSRGGETYVYHVAAAPAKPDFTLRCDDDKALIGPGSGYAMYVIAARRNGFAGEIRLAVEGLPSGVTVTADRIPANMTQACVIFRAAPDAKPDFSRIRIFGTAEIALPDGAKESLRREAAPLQEIYVPGGGRSPFVVNTHAASITGPSDVLLTLSANRIELKPGGTATIEVDVVRQNNYKNNVILDVFLRHLGSVYGNPLPPGVSLDEAASKTLLAPDETKGKIVLKAAADAPEVESLPFAVLGQVSINFVVKVSHASEPVLLSVKK
jgi:hypothetical protein